MATLNSYAFFAKDPSLSPDQIKALLQAKYRSLNIYYQTDIIKIGTQNDKGAPIQIDKSLVQGARVVINNENIVTVLPNMGNKVLGFALGWFEFAFMNFQFAAEVGEYLRSMIGETDLKMCLPCDRRYPHFVENCAKCGAVLTPYEKKPGDSEFLTITNANGVPGTTPLPIPDQNGTSQQDRTIHPVSTKSPTTAAILSLIFAGGGGQIYLGQVKKGIILIAVSLLMIGFGVGEIVWVIGIVDAYLIAKHLQAGDPIKDFQFF